MWESRLVMDQSRIGQIKLTTKSRQWIELELNQTGFSLSLRWNLLCITPACGCENVSAWVWKHHPSARKYTVFFFFVLTRLSVTENTKPINNIYIFIYSNQSLQQKVKICCSLTFGEAGAIMLICKWPLLMKKINVYLQYECLKSYKTSTSKNHNVYPWLSGILDSDWSTYRQIFVYNDVKVHN